MSALLHRVKNFYTVRYRGFVKGTPEELNGCRKEAKPDADRPPPGSCGPFSSTAFGGEPVQDQAAAAAFDPQGQDCSAISITA